MSFRLCATLATVFGVTASLAAVQGSVGQAPLTRTMSATGIVTSVSARSLTIEGTGQRSLTFIVDATTRVFGRGAAVRLLSLRPRGGAAGLSITDVLHSGDRVTVRFQNAGTVLKAIEVRVLPRR